MTIKRTKAGHPAARAKRRLRPAAPKVVRAQSSDTGDITSKPMLIGYARVSTVDQNLALQRDALTEAGCAKIFTEQMSGAVTDRPALHYALEFARSGDTLIVWKLDRLARSMKQLIETVETLRVALVEGPHRGFVVWRLGHWLEGLDDLLHESPGERRIGLRSAGVQEELRIRKARRPLVCEDEGQCGLPDASHALKLVITAPDAGFICPGLLSLAPLADRPRVRGDLQDSNPSKNRPAACWQADVYERLPPLQ
jgi:hypothetical protein